MRWLPLLSLACTLKIGGHREDAPEACYLELHRDRPLGPAPWDGESLAFEPHNCDLDPQTDEASVTLVTRDGDEVPVTRHEDCDDRYVAPDGLPVGEYDRVFLRQIPVAGDETIDLSFDLETPLTVEPFGRDPAFSAADLAGRAFLLDVESPVSCKIPDDLLATFLPGRLWLEFGEPADGEVALSLVQEVESQDQGCVYLQPQAELSPTGELTWQTDHLVLNEDPTFDAWDVHLHLGLDATAEHAAGVELSALVDVGNLLAYTDTGDTAEDWEQTCDLMDSFGLPCQACPESHQPSCVPLEFHSAQAALSEPPWALDSLPACGEILGYDTPEIDPIDCGGCSTTSPGSLSLGLLSLLGLTLLRRREDR